MMMIIIIMKHNPTSIQPYLQSIMQLPNLVLQPHLINPPVAFGVMPSLALAKPTFAWEGVRWCQMLGQWLAVVFLNRFRS